MTVCRVCGAPMESSSAANRGCCDVPQMSSLEEQLSFWLDHDPEQVCVTCPTVECERRPVRA